MMTAPMARLLRIMAEGNPDECWLWDGEKNQYGYGTFLVENNRRLIRKRVMAHRVAYELARGPIPKGLQLDHLCRTRNCVRPDHLEAVDCRTNVLRGTGFAAQKAKQTHCIHGHEFTPENTYVNPSRGTRSCRTCVREHYNRNGKRYRKTRWAKTKAAKQHG